MSYLVLARKWRPRRFSELVGQEHVVRALSHALDSGRVHHAFLFTGTRGVGKTTIARIFAKSLNCERGVGAEPCGGCPVCESVDAGRFVDLIEIDAASNTGVDDVREVIENAQYMPTRGRYKVYLVDEVHMLSRNAFNALLKTLEEPPEHVKFLLATTDPQKLPVTVLSRCLQFNLKRLTEEQILAQMQRILEAEGVAHESASLGLLARAADGSLRDGLSLLDQAIAYGGGALSRDDVAAMLGTVEARDIDGLLDALVREDGPALLRVVEELASFSPDYASVLSDLASALHRVQLFQLVPEAVDGDIDSLLQSAGQCPAELIQLWYQMAVSGKREIELAPTPRIGFEMILLRMLAFGEAPTRSESAADDRSAAGSGRAEARAAVARLQSTPVHRGVTAESEDRPPPGGQPVVDRSGPTLPDMSEAPPTRGVSEPPSTAPARLPPASKLGEPRRILRDNEDWLAAVSALGLRGPATALAQHLAFVGDDGVVIRVGLPENQEHLRMPGLVEKFSEALSGFLGGVLTLSIGKPVQHVETLQQRNDKQRDARQREAEQAFARHPVVEQLVRVHGGQIVPDSVQPRSV